MNRWMACLLAAAGWGMMLTLHAAEPVSFPPMPHAVSSFGAVICDGYLYVYGGHTGKTHHYDTQTVLGRFYRLRLDPLGKWEELPGGPIAQGLNLAAHGGKIYRIGGMQPRNIPGEEADTISLRDCARFDPQSRRWEALPPLPEGRSSHDVVVVGDTLVVVGGWELRGRGQPPRWHDHALLLDLRTEPLQWKKLPQPFQRRALTAAAHGTTVFVVGGLTADGPDPRLDILDLTSGKWRRGPDLPGNTHTAFSPAACVVDGRLVVNTSAGPLYRLNARGDDWEVVGEARRKRMVARLLPLSAKEVLLLGGAGGGSPLDSIEVLTVAAAPNRP